MMLATRMEMPFSFLSDKVFCREELYDEVTLMYEENCSDCFRSEEEGLPILSNLVGMLAGLFVRQKIDDLFELEEEYCGYNVREICLKADYDDNSSNELVDLESCIWSLFDNNLSYGIACDPEIESFFTDVESLLNELQLTYIKDDGRSKALGINSYVTEVW